MLTFCPKAEPFSLETRIKASLNADYVEKNERTLSLKFENSEDDEDQPLDFSTGSNFRNTQESLISEDWRYKSPLYESLLSRVVTKSPDRQRSHDKSPRLLVAPKSPKKGWPNKSPSPESGVSTGSLSPDGSSPVHISPSYFPSFPSFSSRNYSERSSYLDAQARDDKKVNYNHREIPSALSLGLPMAAPSLAQPVDYLSKLSMNHVISYAELTNNIAIMARLRNLGGASLSESNNPLFGQNLLPVTQDQSDNSCTRNLMEKFHIPSSEMPKINASHFDRVYSLEQMQKITQENLKKFQREVMLKKRDDNPSKSRRAAARSAPYSNGRTDLRASDESGQDANGDSQGESVDMEVDARTRQYQEKRRKNNEAAKKSRDQRKLKEEETAIRAAFLEQENGIITQVMIDQFLTIEMLNRRIASLAALQR